MNKIIVGLLALVTSGAMAQSKFEGVYGQVGIGFEGVSPSTSTSVTVNRTNIPSSIAVSNSTSFAGTATLGYTFSLTKDLLLGLGAEYSPLEGQKQNITYNVAGLQIPGGTYNKKNSYSIFVAPGLAVGSDAMAYAKIGYTGAEVDIAGSSENYTGYLLGLGYKQFISGGLYGFGEVNYAKYGNKNVSASAVANGNITSVSITSSMTSTNVLVGVGYRF